ncbi:MAG: acyl-CoA dehydrogenase family protein [Acidobacteriaceae bacterium]|nr:acyl-CoA dehydrogenase family protein [Acidobacteriaceae bacterium]
MTSAEATATKFKGGSFLIEDTPVDSIFTVEDLSGEHKAVARTAEEFWKNELQPSLEGIWNHTPGLAVSLLRRSAELGLTAISIPEEYGGLEMDLPSALAVEEQLGKDASYAAWHGAHTGIGTLPLLYFGTEEQKRRYLPRLARAELIAAYALTEPHAGSDALAARTRADLSPDGKHYLLSGQKMWITNGGAADLFTVFAKVGGEQFTAFLVERSFGGVTSGAEEKKMGIKGSSTTAIFFENTPVPVENLLGEIGRGHVIAFNILNVGRLKLGALAVAGAKDVLAISARYAKERRAFGSPIARFGAIQHKLAEMTIRTYAAESVTWRSVGLIESLSAEVGILKAVEEFAVECSMAKVIGSEALDYVVDEGVQIHGGYGYHQDYAVERAYRDSRINRIFEGTNEINRLLIPGMLLKRAARGQLPLLAAAAKLAGDLPVILREAGGENEDEKLVRNAKRLALLILGLTARTFGAELESRQELSTYLADIIMDVFAMESVFLRSRKSWAANKASIAPEICMVYVRDRMANIERVARNVIGACTTGDERVKQMSVLKTLAGYDPLNSIELRAKIAARVLERERYPF